MCIQLLEEIESLAREYYELQGKKLDVRKFGDQLLDAYSKEYGQLRS